MEKNFQSGYAFTTENISGYISNMDIKNKSVLTLGSSCDQVFNCLLLDAKDVTIFDINKTVATADVDKAIVGDFANMFKWGYAKQIPLEIIQYGDPDNSGKDLKGYNQIYIRAEVYLGWGILDGSAFARITNA